MLYEFIETINKKNIVIFGMTMLGCVLAQALKSEGMSVCFFDNDVSKQGKTGISDVECFSPFKNEKHDVYIIMMEKTENRCAAVKQLEKLKIDGKVIEVDDLRRKKILFDTDDDIYIKGMWNYLMKRDLNLDNPHTFNEKIQWLKLYDRKDIHTDMADKVLAKKIVSDKIGSEYVIPFLGVWDSCADIDFDKLPQSFVLKCTHDSGSIVFCKDKDNFDKNQAIMKLSACLKRNYFYYFREWAYKNIKPRIVAEPYIKSPNNNSLAVYKIMCFGGKARIIQTIQNDKQENESIDYFDRDWNLLNLRQNYPNSPKPYQRPESLSQMIEFAEILSEGEIFVRIDFYEINKKPIFSEFTFYSDSGTAEFEPEEWDERLGAMIKLPKL